MEAWARLGVDLNGPEWRPGLGWGVDLNGDLG